ncbi:MAG: hypothetical protein U9O24_00065 [Campylobacterota bacterium]|nr:hypothetical protein [Campylobacterota bacterium]
MNKEIKTSILILLIGFTAIGIYWFTPLSSQSSKKSSIIHERVILPQNNSDIYQDIPQVKAYLQELKDLISQGKAVLPLQDRELDAHAQKAQQILLKDEAFLKDTKQENRPLHNDMMRILPVIVSTLESKTKSICETTRCYQAEKYNYVTNATTRAVVDVDNAKVLTVQHYPNMQPDISLRLTRIAQAIALNAPEVKRELGYEPSKKDMTMANVRGSLQGSPCENSEHLCVAPTFADHKNEQALWAIVDLTDLKLAAAKWAGLGKTATPACISERSLQNRHIMENFCQKNTILEKNGWKLSYRITGSDGLEIIDVSYKGKAVLKSAKIVDWHVSYKQKGAANLDTSTPAVIEGRLVEYNIGDDDNYLFGYNDAMGCPMFSTSVVLPFNAPQVKKLQKSDGFMLTQDYRNPKWPMACNYRYENRFEFYDDGSFRVVAVNKGRGCGDNAIYRPVMRIDMDLGGKEAFYSYAESWKVWKTEGSEKVKKQKSPYPYKVISKTEPSRGYYIEPNYGQFGDKSRGDNANIFVTRFKEYEGATDLLTLGSCCNLDEDGVEVFIEDKENIDAQNIVIWYVPRIRNDIREGQEYCWADTVIGANGNLEVKMWPCNVGPKFVPVANSTNKE